MKEIEKSLGGATGQWTFVHKVNGISGPFSLQHKKVMLIFPNPKISDHSVINAPKITAKENCENVNALQKIAFLWKLLHLGQGNCWNSQNISTVISLIHEQRLPNVHVIRFQKLDVKNSISSSIVLTVQFRCSFCLVGYSRGYPRYSFWELHSLWHHFLYCSHELQFCRNMFSQS